MPTAQKLPKVLKAGSAASDAQTTYNFIDLRQRCDDYVDRVRRQCRGWVQEAEEETDAIRKAAYDEGRQQGLRDGLADAAAQITKQATTRSDTTIATAVATAIPALEAAAQDVQTNRRDWLQRWEQDAVKLAIAIAERLTLSRLTIDPETLAERVLELVRLAGGADRVTVAMHPDDIAAISRLPSPPEGITFEPDETLSPGDAIASTGEGLVDARLKVQLDAIQRELME